MYRISHMPSKIIKMAPETTFGEWTEMKKKHCEEWYLLWPISPLLFFLQRLFHRKGGIRY